MILFFTSFIFSLFLFQSPFLFFIFSESYFSISNYHVTTENIVIIDMTTLRLQRYFHLLLGSFRTLMGRSLFSETVDFTGLGHMGVLLSKFSFII